MFIDLHSKNDENVAHHVDRHATSSTTVQNPLYCKPNTKQWYLPYVFQIKLDNMVKYVIMFFFQSNLNFMKRY